MTVTIYRLCVDGDMENGPYGLGRTLWLYFFMYCKFMLSWHNRTDSSLDVASEPNQH